MERLGVTTTADVGVETLFEPGYLVRNRVENAAVGLAPGEAFGCRAAVAKEALKNHARIQLHRQRRGG